MGNPKPAFVLRDVELARVTWFGKASEHLRLHLVPHEDEFRAAPLEAMTFYAKRQLGARSGELAQGQRVTLLAHLERDMFTKGQPVRLRIIALS
jgi:single-stranded DNA-specific DHH superfamily exonuclease